MSSYTAAVQYGGQEIPAANFAPPGPVSAATMQQLSSNAEFAIARNEQFFGFYKVGDTIVLPVSPIDGYVYALDELRFNWSIYWTGSAGSACGGISPVSPATNAQYNATPPTRSRTTGGGTMLQLGYWINPSSGVVACEMDYYNGTQNDTGDGILWVETIAQRARCQP